MKIKRNQLLMILLVTGFFIGIIYTSRQEVETTVFDVGILANFKGYELSYIIWERLRILILVVFLGQVYWKHIYGGLLTVIFGVSLGSLITTAVCKTGIKGVLLWMAGMFPHMGFYGLAYTILICYWLDKKKGRWSWKKSIGIILFMSIGIVCEVYVNPFFLKIFFE